MKPRLVAYAAFALTASGCTGALELTPSDARTVLRHQALEVENPAASGPLEVLTLYYGSGTDKNRPEYRDSVSIRTAPVDGSALVRLGASAASRNGYWGFSPDSLPINARVWYPDGPGPYPLVLVVHGNHDMTDYSDPGYDWLGELLASRGYILASVDMNFINGGIRDENDGRGWLLLQHLKAWSEFAEDADNPFQGRVDMGNIALIGHSRGGEAVGHAAAFNRLSRYPDDANIEFDFQFDIKAVIAIAPVDGQYLPADQRTPVENVNYMVFHGSHDSDVTSFHGLRQFNRVSFTDGGDWFKTAIYVYRANHGQWNTVWGANDGGPRSSRFLDLRGLLPAEDQREFGRIYVSAFLDIALKGNSRYRPLFRDHRVAGGWLPKTMYITRFEDSSFRPLVTFDEDIDVTTGTAEGVRLEGSDLATWREGELQLRSSNRPNTPRSQINQAVWLGWNNTYAGSAEPAPAAYYDIVLPDGLASRWRVSSGTSLELHLTGVDGAPPPRPRPDGATAVPGGVDGDPDPLDLSIEVADRSGVTARVALSDYGPVRRPLEMRILRRRDLENQRFQELSELILQHYSIPISDFLEVAPSLDPSRLARIRLSFDRASAGTVAVDEIGLARMHPGFLSARVPR